MAKILKRLVLLSVLAVTLTITLPTGLIYAQAAINLPTWDDIKDGAGNAKQKMNPLLEKFKKEAPKAWKEFKKGTKKGWRLFKKWLKEQQKKGNEFLDGQEDQFWDWFNNQMDK